MYPWTLSGFIQTFGVLSFFFAVVMVAELPFASWQLNDHSFHFLNPSHLGLLLYACTVTLQRKCNVDKKLEEHAGIKFYRRHMHDSKTPLEVIASLTHLVDSVIS